MKTRNGKSTYRRHKAEITYAKLRSRISNGRSLLSDVDHRSAAMRRLKDLVSDHISDLGGADAISSSERVLVRRAAMLCLQCELMESHWNAEGGEADTKQIETYQRCVNTLRRTLESLGLGRRPRDITPDYRGLVKRIKEQHPE
jgi:hypothetical protein